LRLDDEDYRISPRRARMFRWGLDPIRPLRV
jgi:hypothetical protein